MGGGTGAEVAVMAATERLKAWLLDAAAPLWAAAGADPAGGFRERIDLASGKGTEEPRRTRVQPRQIYAFIAAGRLGWDGDWRGLAGRGLDWYLRHYFLGDGTAGSLVAADGTMLDPGFDLYNQAFALFALAAAADALPQRRPSLEQRANALLQQLRATLSHPEAGFEEASPRRLPLCSNPHMHLFEAALAWEDIADVGTWSALADEIAGLALRRFIDPVSGGLREFFDGNWRPMPGDRGRVMEPGHQFEWAWLLARWGVRRGRADAVVAARRLFFIGETHGVCPDRKVAVMALNDDFALRDPLARLWGQTEWIKAAIALANVSVAVEREHYLASTVAAVEALEKFLAVPIAGLWHDKMESDGRFVDEPAPASSFYHIVCAIAELDAFARTCDLRGQATK